MGRPVLPGSTLDIVSKDNITYKLGYLCGDRQDAFFDYQQKQRSVIEKHIPEARRRVNRTTKKALSAEVLEGRTLKLAAKLAGEAIDKNKKLTLVTARELVDLFLVGWEGENLPEFPKANPSMSLCFGDLQWLASEINSKISELTGLEIETAKN